MSGRVVTKLYPKVFSDEEAREMYLYLKNNLKWEEGVTTRQGRHTRKACPYDEEDELISTWISRAFSVVTLPGDPKYLGAYINYYQDGTDYTPSHTHPKQIQLVISLGATRTLIVGKKKYSMHSGDVAVFGASAHSVPKEPKVKRGRISIATFSIRSP